MKILVTGGGSGGHIAPVLAVAHELKKLQANEIIYIGQKGDGLLDVVEQNVDIDRVVTISAGKFRRYSGVGWRQLLDFKTQMLNLRDIFRTISGIWQSYKLIGREKPNVIFTRGGFVSVPVALAARLRSVPYITHDADSIPSLANRIIAPWATLNAVSMPIDTYKYPAEKIVLTGIPVGRKYHEASKTELLRYKNDLDMDDYQQIVLITGGGNGARALNMIAVRNAKYLLSRFPDLAIIHFTGRLHEKETTAAYDALELGNARSRVKVYSFVNDFYRFSAIADVVIARGGMSSLAEFALQKKACILVPSPQLSWNIKNSRTLEEKGAIVALSEDQAEQPERLGHVVESVLNDSSLRQQLGARLGVIAKPRAAVDIAELILQVGKD